MKKILSIVLVVVLVLSMSSMVFANNGKGKGLATAPGQAENFFKGVTTIVSTEDTTRNDVIVTEEPKVVSVVPKETTDKVVGVPVVTTRVEKHPQQDWYRTVTITTTTTTHSKTTWTETSTVTLTKETDVTINGITTTTIAHRGAPGSNGEVISNESLFEETGREEGDTVVVNVSDPVITISDLETITWETVEVKEQVPGWGQVN